MDPSKTHRVYLCDLRGATNPTIIKKFYDEVSMLGYFVCLIGGFVDFVADSSHPSGLCD